MKNKNKDTLRMVTAAILGCGVAATTAWAYDQRECNNAIQGYQQCSATWAGCDGAASSTFTACVANCIAGGGTESECLSGDCDSDYSLATSECEMDFDSCQSEWQDEIDFYCC
jgi:hypothetical protein